MEQKDNQNIQRASSPNSSPQKSNLQSDILSAVIGAGTGAIAGLACVSALGLGIVSMPAVVLVAGTAVTGAVAFYLIKQEIQKSSER